MDDTWVRNCTCIFFPLVRTRKKNELPHIIFIIVCRSDVQFTAPLPRFSVDVIILPPIFSHCVRHWNGCHVRLAQRNPRSGRYVHPLVRFICRSDIVVSVIPGRRMVDRMYGTECVPPVVDRWITRLREKDWSVSICREHQRKGGGGKVQFPRFSVPPDDYNRSVFVYSSWISCRISHDIPRAEQLQPVCNGLISGRRTETPEVVRHVPPRIFLIRAAEHF